MLEGGLNINIWGGGAYLYTSEGGLNINIYWGGGGGGGVSVKIYWDDGLTSLPNAGEGMNISSGGWRDQHEH